MNNIHLGRCYCGAISYDFHTNLRLNEFEPRACDCNYCIKNGIVYISDNCGQLVFDIDNLDIVKRYQQGSKNASFITCRECFVVVAAIVEIDNVMLGAINGHTLDNSRFLKEAVTVSPKSLNKEQKLTRWSQIWIPDVKGFCI